ncbi:MAG: hypothetical protein QOH25_2063 [Acidobacteriota bacterium]|nr:hypothetical protein [Acidobacteriota bacterium]
MKRCSVIFCLFILSELFAVNSVAAQEKKNCGKQSDGISHLIGNWSGESICVNKDKFPACHDEQVIYRIVESSGKSNMLTVTMDKIVNGTPETMGVLDFVYDAQKQTLFSEFTRNNRHGIWEFAVNGDLMDGTLATLPDKIIVRRIKVKR